MSPLLFSQPGTSSPRRYGFTLVELLVVVGVLGVLMALLLPAVQAARESARQIECKNNIKQLALACHSHHDVHAHFPTGGWGWYWVGDADRGFGTSQPGGWIFNSLPYFEQYALYGQSSDGNPERATRTQKAGAAKVIQTPLTMINCPSRRANRIYPMTSNRGGQFGYFNSLTPRNAGRSDYAINSGHVYNEWPDVSLGRGPISYSDADAWDSYGFWGGEQGPLFKFAGGELGMTGISFERSEVAVHQVLDGLSKTYLLGEKYIPYTDYENGTFVGDNETWCTGFNNDNYRRTGRLVDGEIVESTPLRDSVLHSSGHLGGDHVSSGRFGSAHTSVWNVAYCDGSVQGISYEIDWQIHRDLGNRSDQNVASGFSLTSY